MTSSTAAPVRTGAPEGSAASPWAVILCWIAVALDGFDLVVLGAVTPVLLQTQHLGFDKPGITVVATAGLVGVGIGAVTVGPLTDRFGRRSTMLVCVTLFSIFTLLIPFSTSIAMFGAFRVIAGLGLGACLPTALALITENAGVARAARANTLVMTGYHVGAVVTTSLALAFAVTHWHWIFYAGGIIGLVLVPLLWLKLPESQAFLDGKQTRATKLPISTVVKKTYLVASLGLCVASFMGLFLVYGLNQWLPTMMGEAGYGLATGLTLLLLLNVGAIVGLVIAGQVGDSRGIKPSAILWFGAAAVLLALLSIKMDNAVLLHATVFVTGVFVFSAQVLIYAFVASIYPADVRGTALGMAAGVGRIGAIVGPFITGALLTAGLAYPWGFYVFAAAGVLALLALAVVPPTRDAVERRYGRVA